jgi:hypothetical protein
MLLKGNICSGKRIFELLGITPQEFNQETIRYVTGGPADE